MKALSFLWGRAYPRRHAIFTLMDWLSSYFLRNFILLCMGAILLVNAIQHFKENRRQSLFLILITGSAVILGVSQTVMEACKAYGNMFGTIFCSYVGYSLRPVIVYFFILMALGKPQKPLFYLTTIPLIINGIIYLFAFFPATKAYVVNFVYHDDGTIGFGSGTLRFSSHIIAAFYIVWLVYISISALRRKHFNHGIALLLCAFFVVAAVVVETFFDDDAEAYLLNPSIVLSALTYYLYAYIERTQKDPLTGVYNRAAYYRDLPRMEKSLVGVVQFDLNGLKYLNDNLGHEEGDHALLSVARAILEAAKGDMYAYRLGGDEFIVLANRLSEEGLTSYVAEVKKTLSASSYRCSIGYAFREERSTTVQDLIKTAERRMYQDKEEFYRTTGIERRRGERPE